MTFKEYKYLVRSGLYRIDGVTTYKALLRELLFCEGFAYAFWFRTRCYLESGAISRFTLAPIARMILRRHKYQVGISISADTKIGPGFYIGHFGGIIVNGNAVIGRDVNLSTG